MGSGSWSTDVYDAAKRYRRATGTSAFAYHDSLRCAYDLHHLLESLQKYGPTFFRTETANHTNKKMIWSRFAPFPKFLTRLSRLVRLRIYRIGNDTDPTS